LKAWLQAGTLAVDFELQVCHCFIEQAVPCRPAGHRFLVEQLLDPVFELIGFVEPADPESTAHIWLRDCLFSMQASMTVSSIRLSSSAKNSK
jgi:hypothetical protein